MLELQAYAFEQKKEGKVDLAEFLISRSRKTVVELIDATWEMKEAENKLEWSCWRMLRRAIVSVATKTSG